MDRGPAARAFAALGRLAGYGFAALTPEPLYATDAGITKFKSISPIGSVDPSIFDERFLVPPYVPGTFPATVAAPGVGDTDREGSWRSYATAPGALSIVTNPEFGNDNYVLKLEQGGGNCTTSCGGLFLIGTVESFPTAGRGVHDVRLEAMQERSQVKEAPFYVRTGPTGPTVPGASGDTAGFKLAKLAYKTLSNPNRQVLTFNDSIVNGVSWAAGAKQTFTIRVDLYTTTGSNGTVRLLVDGDSVSVGNGANWRLPFYEGAQAGPQRIGQFTAEFTGIDAGVVYIDDVAILRRYDASAAPQLPEQP